MHVTIAIPSRGIGLPRSLRFRQVTAVAVTVQCDPGDPQGPVEFVVANASGENGVASVEGPQELLETGTIHVRGNAQTEPGHGGLLVIRAMCGGTLVGTSDGFSVCSHPTCVENGPQHEVMTLAHVESDNAAVGLKVWIRLRSDSGVDDDLSAVREMEVVADAHDFTGAATKAPKSGNSKWQWAHEVDPDRHRARADLMNAIDQTQLHGAQGGWSNDQLDVFFCTRCGMSEEAPAVIPNSGYRVTRVFSTIPGGQLQLVLRKHPKACAVKGFETAAGPSEPLEVEATVPKQEVGIG